jgi:hypothetical protein
MRALPALIQLLVTATSATEIAAPEPQAPATRYVPGTETLGMRFSALVSRFDASTQPRFGSPSQVGMEGAIYYVHRGVFVGVDGLLALDSRIGRTFAHDQIFWPEGERVDVKLASVMAGYRFDRERHAFGPVLGLGGAWLHYVTDDADLDEVSFLTATVGLSYQCAVAQSRTISFSEADYLAQYRLALVVQALAVKALTSRDLEGRVSPTAFMLLFGIAAEKRQMVRAGP